MLRNPFRSEAEAFRFLMLTVVAFAAIAIASVLGGAWGGASVWAVLTAAAVALYLVPRPAGRELRTAPPRLGGADERLTLVVVADTQVDGSVVGAIEKASIGYRKRVLVVCPARVSRVDRWTSAVDGARAQSQRHLDESLACLRAAGIEAQGAIGDEDPLRAIEDALRTFGADSIVVATPSDRADGSTAPDVVAGAQARFALPVARVVVDAVAQTATAPE